MTGGEEAVSPGAAVSTLQTFVSVLRSHLSEDRERARRLVITEAEAYRFATDLVDLDLDGFDELLERSAHEPTRLARRSLEQALGLVRGEVFEDEPYANWAQGLRSTYQGRVLGAHLEAADAALAELDYAAALAHAEAAVALDRFSERAHRGAMLALYALGRQRRSRPTGASAPASTRISGSSRRPRRARSSRRFSVRRTCARCCRARSCAGPRASTSARSA